MATFRDRLRRWLREWGAPADIDYMSVDTEGSELTVLSALWTFRRVLAELSQFDDWYMRSA